MNHTTSDKPIVDQTKPARRSRSAASTAKHPYKGITLIQSSGRYKATAWDWEAKRNVPLGHFRLPSQAARAYDEGIRSIRGNEAVVNFETEEEALTAIRADVLRELITCDHTVENYLMFLAELGNDGYGRKIVSKMLDRWQSLIEGTPDFLKTELPVVLKPAGFICSLHFRNRIKERQSEILDEAYDPDARIFWKLYREGLECQGIKYCA